MVSLNFWPHKPLLKLVYLVELPENPLNQAITAHSDQGGRVFGLQILIKPGLAECVEELGIFIMGNSTIEAEECILDILLVIASNNNFIMVGNFTGGISVAKFVRILLTDNSDKFKWFFRLSLQGINKQGSLLIESWVSWNDPHCRSEAESGTNNLHLYAVY